MRWREGRQSTNIEDRRGMRVRRPAVVGGGGLILVVAVVMALCGKDPTQLLRMLEDTSSPPSAEIDSPGSFPGGLPSDTRAPADEKGQFVSVVLADTEDTWSRVLAQEGMRYQPPRLVLFTDMVESACGLGSAAVGPFYCPGDRKVYLDLGFFEDLSERFGAPGDFAQAYVVAHEIGHNAQNLLGMSDQVRAAQAQARSEREVNALNVMMELQADCLAGVWGHHAASRLLEEGDIEEGLRAAAAIGDDRIQNMSTGRVSPESWTHGSSDQRSKWLRRGLQSGSVQSCDTFSAGR